MQQATTDRIINELLRRWRESRNSGPTLTPQEMCREHPELLPEFLRRLVEPSAVTPEGELDAETNGARSERDKEKLPVGLSVPGIRYEGVEFHAKGGLGEVYKAHDGELHRQVALKRIQNRWSNDPECQMRFLLEAEITGRLEHPGVVPVYGLTHDAEGQPCYAMRFIEGTTLKNVIEAFHAPDPFGKQDTSKKHLEFREMLSRFISICNTVAYAHSRGILHRDLKPTNVMIGPYGETLVVDWGLAKLYDHPLDGDNSFSAPKPATAEGGTEVGRGVGTPGYVSPEQAAGDWSRVGPTSDVYSLGAVLYAILSGHSAPTPDPNQSTASPLASTLTKKRVPAPLVSICQKAMSVEPMHRYASPTELATEVEHWLADEPVSVYSDSLLARANRWGRRHRTLAPSTAALLLTTMFALAIGLIVVTKARNNTAEAYSALSIQQVKTQEALDAEAKRRSQTRQALDAMSSRVIGDLLAKQNRLTPEQKTFLEQALGYYQEFAADTGNDESVRAAVGAAHSRMGAIRSRLGQMADAANAYRAALAAYERLADEFPDNLTYRRQLASSHHSLGGLCWLIGQPQEGEAQSRTAAAKYAQLISEFPNDPENRDELASILSNLAYQLQRTGKIIEAGTAHTEAVKVLIQLAADFPKVSEYKYSLGRSQQNIGIFFAQTGKPKDAEDAFRAALAVTLDLYSELPQIERNRLELAKNYSNLGLLLTQTGRFVDAEKQYREAQSHLSQLAAEFPSVPEYRQKLAGAHLNCGLLFDTCKRHKDAEASYRDALAIMRRLAADFPVMAEYRQDLGRVLSNLGILLSDLNQNDAEPTLKEAIAVRKQLVTEFPEAPEYQLQLARSQNCLSNVLRVSERTAEAELLSREAMENCRRLVDKFPNAPDYQHELACAIGNVGLVAEGKKDFALACDHYDEAKTHFQNALRANPRHPEYKRNFGVNRRAITAVFIKLGKHARAAAAAEELLEATIDPANDSFLAACFLAHCGLLAENDSSIEETRRETVREAYNVRALAALGRAVRHGYKDLEQLQTQKDLDPLRENPEFKELLRDLQSRNATRPGA